MLGCANLLWLIATWLPLCCAVLYGDVMLAQMPQFEVRCANGDLPSSPHRRVHAWQGILTNSRALLADGLILLLQLAVLCCAVLTGARHSGELEGRDELTRSLHQNRRNTLR